MYEKHLYKPKYPFGITVKLLPSDQIRIQKQAKFICSMP